MAWVSTWSLVTILSLRLLLSSVLSIFSLPLPPSLPSSQAFLPLCPLSFPAVDYGPCVSHRPVWAYSAAIVPASGCSQRSARRCKASRAACDNYVNLKFQGARNVRQSRRFFRKWKEESTGFERRPTLRRSSTRFSCWRDEGQSNKSSNELRYLATVFWVRKVSVGTRILTKRSVHRVCGLRTTV